MEDVLASWGSFSVAEAGLRSSFRLPEVAVHELMEKLHDLIQNRKTMDLRNMKTWRNLGHIENTRAEISPTPPGGVYSNSRGSEPAQ